MNNVNGSKAQKPQKISFSTKETEDYYHKAAFLRYLNKFEPDIQNTLGELLPLYVSLFGKHLPFDHSSFIFPPDFQYFYSEYFTINSWQENNSKREHSHTVRRYLSQHNESLKSCRDYIDQRWDEVKDAVQKFLNDPQTSEDIRKVPDAEKVLIRMLWEKFTQEERNLKIAFEFEDSTVELFHQFRKMFFENLIYKFHLKKEWLCLSAFLAIQEGKLKLEMPWNYWIPCYPLELLRELHGEKNELLGMRYFPTGLPYPNELPLHPSFQFNEAFGIHITAEEYENQAVAAYRKHIRKYVADMQQALISHGYKRKRRSHDYSRIKWLIRWTVQGWTMNAILDEHTRNESSGKSIDESTVRKAFKSFEKYDLPVRKKRGDESQPEVISD
jgi:hypothetical protein